MIKRILVIIPHLSQQVFLALEMAEQALYPSFILLAWFAM